MTITNMRRYLIHLSYFGTRYRGFQKQNADGITTCDDPLTICGLIEIALKKLEPIKHPVVFPSSRTDKGVHALCNTVHVDLSSDKWRLNSDLIHMHLNRFFKHHGHDIWVLKTQEVAADFHCRHKAYERLYIYRFAVPKPATPFRPRLVTPIPITETHRCQFLQKSTFDSEAVKSACSIFVGTKDFTALSSRARNSAVPANPIREVRGMDLVLGAPFYPVPNLLEDYTFWNFTVRSKSFLYHQVRRMVTALIGYGQSTVTLADVQRLIDEPVPESWTCFGNLYPPDGLFLTNVLYHPEDLELELTEEEREQRKLEEEEAELTAELANYEGNVLGKISLKEKLLNVKHKLGLQKFPVYR